MPRALKVYRTPMGFEDAVVAASSQAAALKAWGVRANLFAEGLAETVSGEPELEARARAAPGEVLRLPRGDAEALLAHAARPARPARPAAKTAPSPPTKAKTAPDRSRLRAAEKALAEAQARSARETAELEDELAALQARRERLQRDGAKRVAQAQARVDRERRAIGEAAED